MGEGHSTAETKTRRPVSSRQSSSGSLTDSIGGSDTPRRFSDLPIKKPYDLEFCDVDSVDSHEFTDALEDITPQVTPKPKKSRRTASRAQLQRNSDVGVLRSSSSVSRRPKSLGDELSFRRTRELSPSGDGRGIRRSDGMSSGRRDRDSAATTCKGYMNSSFKTEENGCDDDDEGLSYYSPVSVSLQYFS